MGSKTMYTRRYRKGGVFIQCVVTLVVLTGVCSLAVDLGRVQLAKSELRRTTDAAARYAVTGVNNGTALSRANWVAAQNPVDGTTHTFPSADVEVGKWDTATRTFTPGGGSPNAVRVTGRRTAATGNPVPTAIAQSIGVNSVDVTVQSVALVRVSGYGVVGLNYIYMSGNSSDSYWSQGATGGTMGEYGSIASNGPIVLQGSSSVHGDARPGIGKQVFGGHAVTGNTAPLESPLVYPNGDAGNYAYVNNNSLVPSTFKQASSLKVSSNKTLTLPGGNYYFNNIEIGGTISFTGPATIYCYGDFNMYGHAQTSGNLPGNLKLVMCPDTSGNPPGTVNIGSGASLYADIYAPQSDITLSGNGDIYGSVVGRSVSMTGTSTIHYDLALDPENGRIALVQ